MLRILKGYPFSHCQSVIAKRNQLRDKSASLLPPTEKEAPGSKDHIMASFLSIRPLASFTSQRPQSLGVLAAVVLMIAAMLSGCGQSTDTSKSSGTPAVVARPPDPNDPVVAKVNGTEIRQSDLKIAEEDLGQNSAALSPDAKRDYLVTYLADIILVAGAAEGKKIGDNVDFQRHLVHVRNKLLAEFMLQAEINAAVTDDAMRKVYEDATKGMSDEQEVRARHILIRVADVTDEKASKDAEAKIKAIIERLNKGEDFTKLASELTEDPSGKQNGGDLDYFTKDQMVPEFSTVAFQLEKGQISGPIKTQFGWHVLKVEDKRNRQPPEFDKVKDQVKTIVTRKAQGDFIAKLREGAKIERLDKPAEKK
jgi:peptidyl-prolyl cis-trans isomerase C